jgi:hypothetical protein
MRFQLVRNSYSTVGDSSYVERKNRLLYVGWFVLGFFTYHDWGKRGFFFEVTFYPRLLTRKRRDAREQAWRYRPLPHPRWRRWLRAYHSVSLRPRVWRAEAWGRFVFSLSGHYSVYWGASWRGKRGW